MAIGGKTGMSPAISEASVRRRRSDGKKRSESKITQLECCYSRPCMLSSNASRHFVPASVPSHLVQSHLPNQHSTGYSLKEELQVSNSIALMSRPKPSVWCPELRERGGYG